MHLKIIKWDSAMILERKWRRWLWRLSWLGVLFALWLVLRDFLPSGVSYERQDDGGRKVYDHWGPYNRDIEWLPNLKKKRSDEIPVVVVEEHYEVLKYWFQAADLGIIQKSNNILIHIDGHVDGAVPLETENLPWFRPPRSRQEIHNMMQRNDIFIVTAALTGLINHVIWIWPNWDSPKDKGSYGGHLNIYVEMGFVRLEPKVGMIDHKLDLCACWQIQEFAWTDREKVKLENNMWECHRQNFSEVEVERGPAITRSQCQIQSKGLMQVMSEARAVSEFKKWKQFGKPKNLILDIDEDFFGCWSDMIVLQEAGISQKRVELLSDLVSELLCAQTASDEQTADKFYSSVIHFIRNLKLQSCEHMKQPRSSGQNCLTNIEISNFVIERLPHIVDYLKNVEGGSNILCHEEPKLTGLFLQSLANYLQDFTIEQLSVLEDLGICFDISPSSLYFPSNGQLHVCHGENMPNNTQVVFHLPTVYEIKAQFRSFKSILFSVMERPDFITVCRSVRDGYTPKKYFHEIEMAVLKGVSSAYRRVQFDKIHFDGNLLGKQNGWPSRPHDWNGRL